MRGELVDQSYAVSGAQEWAEKASGILGTGTSKGYPIVSFRCKNCGFLKNYAIAPGKEAFEEQIIEK